MLLHMSRLWVSWSDLTEVVKKGPGSGQKPPGPMDIDSRRAFIGAMHVIGRVLSERNSRFSGLARLPEAAGYWWRIRDLHYCISKAQPSVEGNPV